MQHEPLRVAGRASFMNEFIELAGGENAIDPTIHTYPVIGTEQLINSDVDVIIQCAMGDVNLAGQREQAEQFWSGRPSLPAVKNNRIYLIEPDTVCRLSPRIAEGLETVYKCLHQGAGREKH